MEAKTKEQMEVIAKEMFGEEARVYYSNNVWHIETGVEERFNPEDHKGRAAYEAFMCPEGNYGSDLDRWAYKNGHSSESMAELFDSYDEEQERSARESVAKVRDWIDKGVSFEGLEDYRDRVLAYAEEKGW